MRRSGPKTYFSESEVRALLRKAALVAERAYRRGFQHGVFYCEKFGISNLDAARFRFRVSTKRAYGAPEKDSNGKVVSPRSVRHSLVERHFKMEGEAEEISDFFTLSPLDLLMKKRREEKRGEE